MSTKFSNLQIIRDHIKTLKIYNSGAIDKLSLIMNFGFPLILAFTFLYFHSFLQSSIITVLITVLSIFIALLLNLLFLMYSILSRRLRGDNEVNAQQAKNEGTSENKIRIRLLKETYYNVQFSVLVCVYALIAIILYVLLPKEIYLDLVLGFIVYYFLFVFITTLLMILKRTHTLFSREF